MEYSSSSPPIHGEIIPNSYIVTMDHNITDKKFQDHLDWAAGLQRGSKIRLGHLHGDIEQPCEYTYNIGNLKGFSGTFDSEAYKEIKAHGSFVHIEPNTVVTPCGKSETPPADFVHDSQSTTLWRLRTISHRKRDSPDVYVYDESAGEGVTIFVLDSGIRITHAQLVGRASFGYNTVKGTEDTDVYGHGTHVSGTIIGSQYGIARRAKVVSVKIFDDHGRGSTARTMAAIEWVARNAKPMSVANMSFSSPHSKIYNMIIDIVVWAGLTCVVAAGNNATDAHERSPASAARAICAGAVDEQLTRSMLSNFGPALSLFAPGVYIVSCGVKNDTDTDLMTGTSMACAHVSGVAAYLISKEKLKTPKAVADRLTELATRDVVEDKGAGSPNLFLYNGSGE